jgi:acetyltransferase-like isoleucine patch superfamily enzyme
MVRIRDWISRYRFFASADRLGPDMPVTHWRLYIPHLMQALCEKKFKHFGEGAQFRPGAYAEACSKIEIGAEVVIRPGSFLFADPRSGGAGITIEDYVLLGSAIHIYTNNHEFSKRGVPIAHQGYPEACDGDRVRICKGAWIGAAAIILPGVTIGENAVIGAGSVVTRSVPADSVSVGSPARVIRGP